MGGPRYDTHCIFPGCRIKVFGNHYCHKHYKRLWYHGIAMPKQIKKTGVAKCIISDCEGIYLAKGFCNKHYKRIRKLQLKHKKFQELKDE